ncbi:MAG: hypothetical protein LBF89_05245 [Bacteroidales bacterium]|jgi:hypothetical protein|nr:hypothetical protein [Bacteroidales bacterium]
MKKIIFATLFLTLSLCGFAQKKVTYANKQQIDDFFKSKTMIVLDANPMIGYNIVIANAVKKYWKITPFEIISSDRFDETFTDPKLSFIFLSRVTLAKQEEVCYLYMNIVMGNKVKDITDLPELLSLPLAYTGVDEDNYVDKLPLMLQFAQIHLNRIHEKGFKMPYSLKDYNDNVNELKNKTLYLKESDLSKEVSAPDDIKKLYSGKVKIVSSEEITQAIEQKEPNAAVLLQIGPAENENSGRSYRLIYSIDNGNLLYYNFQNITQKTPAGMLAKDFKWLENHVR